MNKYLRTRSSYLVGLTTAVLLAAAPLAWADDEDEDEDEIPFDEAELFFELNNTDGDLGIHALIDGDAWKKLKIENADGRPLLKIDVKGNLRRQGLTEIFFESAEPTFDELDPADFFARFPEGEYEISGATLDGEEMESEVELTHLMPAPPQATVNGEAMALVCDEEDPDFDATETSAPVTIGWAAVETSHEELGSPMGSPDITIHNYQVVVEVEFLVDGEEFAAEMSVILPPNVFSMTIPAAFIALGDELKYEVLAREESFNQTAVESCFVLE